MTNFERIKHMDAEEMAEFLIKTTPTICIKLRDIYVVCDKRSVMKWLEQEVEE